MTAGAADRLDLPGGRPLPADESAGAAGDTPYVVRNALHWFALSAASANVVMQLSRLPVGRGVAESKVESGRIDKHPIKRGRTTLSYVAVAWHGTDEEREWMRKEVNRSHRFVRSDASSPVKYNAFDRELQLWVAACLYKGTEDVLQALYGPLGDKALDDLYTHAARFGTTLQVPADLWPADREAFAEYWKEELGKLEMDRVTRAYLQALTDLSFLPAPARWTLGRFSRFVTLGFLPPEFREELGLPWSERDQARFAHFTRRAARINRVMPRRMRAFPWNLYLRDARRRLDTGRPFV
ncbi:oxygenase MpaB family protein [Actinomadura rugatobispora]|uniref:Oxygenase MpaB family protein n=1 Tax=Actinomadura rugatobispora TaxID=1994 RepID=A0ABW1A8I7_9ACTN|nr:oxygenase MpaB family protein [Actinomadura rugatobispora]